MKRNPFNAQNVTKVSLKRKISKNTSVSTQERTSANFVVNVSVAREVLKYISVMPITTKLENPLKNMESIAVMSAAKCLNVDHT